MTGYIRLPRSLLIDPLWCGLTSREQHVYLEFLRVMAFEPMSLDDHGVWAHLQPGQYLTTERDFAELCNRSRPKGMEPIDKSFIHRWGLKMKRLNFSNQKVNHVKSIITCTRRDIMEIIEPEIEPRTNQDRTKNEPQKKKDKNEKKEKNKNVSPILPPSPKKSFRDHVTLTEEQYAKLLGEHGQPMVDEMLDILDSFKGSNGKHYTCDYSVMKKGGWVLNRCLENKQKKQQVPFPKPATDRLTKDRNGNPMPVEETRW